MAKHAGGNLVNAALRSRKITIDMQPGLFLDPVAGHAAGDQPAFAQNAFVSNAELCHQLFFAVVCDNGNRHDADLLFYNLNPFSSFFLLFYSILKFFTKQAVFPIFFLKMRKILHKRICTEFLQPNRFNVPRTPRTDRLSRFQYSGFHWPRHPAKHRVPAPPPAARALCFVGAPKPLAAGQIAVVISAPHADAATGCIRLHRAPAPDPHPPVPGQHHARRLRRFTFLNGITFFVSDRSIS